MESERRGGKHRPGYSDAVTESTDPDDSAAEQTLEPADAAVDDAQTDEPTKKRGALREAAILITIALVLYYVMLTFVARPYLIPSESMEPTLHGCTGCVGDRIMVDKVTYRFSSPQPGDVIVFKGPPNWNLGYKSIRSDNTAVRWVQNALSFIGFVPPDENDLVKRVIAVGGQTVECRTNTGLTVDGKRLNGIRAGARARRETVGDGRQPDPFGRFPRALRKYAGRRSARAVVHRRPQYRNGADRQCHWKGTVHRLAAVAMGWSPRGEPADSIGEFLCRRHGLREL